MESQKPRIRPPSGDFARVKSTLHRLGISTVCQESGCPNQASCWSRGTATFMVLGDICTRACRFCRVKTFHRGRPVDTGEPGKLAKAAKTWGLTYVVLTSVDRDDLPDKGAGHFASCIQELRGAGVLVEALIPDFCGSRRCLKTVAAAGPDVIAHNIETVRRLQTGVRDPRASYEQSLAVLTMVKEFAPHSRTKSSLMLGLGETAKDVVETMRDLRKTGVELLTLGQYLRPGPSQLPVNEYIPKERWVFFRRQAEAAGFCVAAGPLVRSSYRAGELYHRADSM